MGVSLTKAGGGWAWRTTPTGEEVVRFPEVSRATAVIEWLPFAAPAVDQSALYGGVVSSVPMSCASTRNCTPAIPALSVALAVSVTGPVIVAPAAGDVTWTVGGDVSHAAVVTDVAARPERLPLWSTASTPSV